MRLFVNLTTTDVAASKEFWCGLFGFEARFDSDWFVLTGPGDSPALELGIIARDHAVTPAAAKGEFGGAYVSLVLDEVDSVHDAAVAAGYEVIEPPTDMFYGQRRLLLRDPGGAVVDVSAPVAEVKM